MVKIQGHKHPGMLEGWKVKVPGEKIGGKGYLDLPVP